MCGIAGIISLKRSIDPNDQGLLSRLLERVKYRGPDDEGFYTDNDLCIGAVRLNIIGGDQGRQPLRKEGTVLVFNGEIYNFQQLSPQSNQAISDTKVLFSLLSQRGIEILNKLNGMFAFCFADSENIYLVRDRFGEKPLYYTIKNNRLYFSSEIKSFLEVMNLKLSLPSYYPQLETTVGADTIFKNVYQVKPGHFLKISRKRKKIQVMNYYAPRIADSMLGFDEAKVHLRELLDNAIKIRVPRGMNFAAYISGGFDSSIIALSSHPQTLLSFVAGGKITINEEKYADILADSLRAEYVKVHAKPADFVLHLYDLIYALDGPTTSLASLSQLLLSKEAHMRGYKVTLSGMGADEFLNGYVRHVFALSDGSLSEFSDYKELHSRITDTQNLVSRYSKLLNRSPKDSSSCIEKMVEPLFEGIHNSSAISLSDNMCTLPPLLTMDDHINMNFSIESRNPFLDHRVVEFALSLRDSYKMMIGDKEISLKHVLRCAYNDLIPEKIRERRDKVGFPSQVNEWLAHELTHLVKKSQEILREVFPKERYFVNQNKDFLYDRRRYQWVQLAATYLIYIERYNKVELQQFFRKDI